MFDVQTLLSLGLSNQLVSVWQVFSYIVVIVICLLFERSRLCLLITYIYAYYLAFLIYWKNHIESSGSMIPFAVYVLSGIAIVVLFVAASVRERAQMKQSRAG